MRQYVGSTDVKFVLLAMQSIYNSPRQIGPMNGIHAQHAIAKEPNTSPFGHFKEVAHIRKEPRWANNTII